MKDLDIENLSCSLINGSLLDVDYSSMETFCNSIVGTTNYGPVNRPKEYKMERTREMNRIVRWLRTKRLSSIQRKQLRCKLVRLCKEQNRLVMIEVCKEFGWNDFAKIALEKGNYATAVKIKEDK